MVRRQSARNATIEKKHPKEAFVSKGLFRLPQLMPLVPFLSTDFPSAIRTRGESYFRMGLVRNLRGSATQVEAEVRGSENYFVSFSIEEGALFGFCECPYFDSSGPCKHLWALVLAADSRGLLQAAQSRGIQHIYEPPSEALDSGDDDYPSEDLYSPPKRHAPTKAAPAQKARAKTPHWKRELAALDATDRPTLMYRFEPWPADRQILYIVDAASSKASNGLVLQLFSRDRKRTGEWTKQKELPLKRAQAEQVPEPTDREVLPLLLGGRQYPQWTYGDFEQAYSRHLLTPGLAVRLMPQIARTGRCFLQVDDNEEQLPVAWDDGGPWRFTLELHPDKARRWMVDGVLRRGTEQMSVREPLLLLSGGLVFTREKVALLDAGESFTWIQRLRESGGIAAPESERDQLLAALLEHPSSTPIEVPPELRYEETHPAPRPRLRLRSEKRNTWSAELLRGELSFDYDGRTVTASSKQRGVYDPATRRLLLRDRRAEEAAETQLRDTGLRAIPPGPQEREQGWGVAPNKLPHVVHTLVGNGWQVEAEGKQFRRPGSVTLAVTSGVDWFELQGRIDYGETTAKLPALLEAARRGEKMVLLGDGTYGLLPEEWLDRLGLLANLGESEKGHVRFRRNQAGVLDALLAAQPEVSFDETFARVRDRLHSFTGVQAAPQPSGFAGQLREYQKEGLGWMRFLREFGFGGCLADDMGVGKTAQVLALLETRREARANGERTAPSLVVVPRSLVFNWKEEAARFTPQLRVLDHTGQGRTTSGFEEYDVVLTTYGTLRRDAVEFKDITFDYIILDEAQAIKNAKTESAKAARLLRSENRLALSGTPVENHLGELWSLFEFLNPGMLGTASVFQLLGNTTRDPDADARQVLARAVRPFILRRTKEQVAKELPAKLEQTLYCELEATQRKLYDELRQHYRDTLLHRIDAHGLAKSKMHVLEALLRLRQAACHPGLIDAKRKAEQSAKLEVLLERLQETLEEGHKALVFSQFTSLLSIVRNRLDQDKVVYEYLDGRTRDRQARVERFQNDSDCKLFLISLKAGGLGLNLTAAEYVFLLDPWWNPAVEAQAIDRAHRIGQFRQVFAYRLIAKDTVEEKVLELQKTKRDLADAILGAEGSVMRDLKREDLELLLS